VWVHFRLYVRLKFYLFSEICGQLLHYLLNYKPFNFVLKKWIDTS